MASVYKPADKAHLYVRYRVDGRWRSKATTFKPGEEPQALAYAEQLEGAPPPVKARPTVKQYYDDWISERSNYCADWINDTHHFRDWILPVIGGVWLDDVKPGHLLDIIKLMKDEEKAPRTIRNVYSSIRAFWRDAMLDNKLDGLITTNPCILDSRHLGKLRDKKLGWRDSAIFTRDELNKLLNTSSELRQVAYALCAVGMLRTGEAIGLKWSRVHLDVKPLGRLVIVASYDKQSTKTGAERWMPIHPILQHKLEWWHKHGWRQHYGRDPTPQDYVLNSIVNTAHPTMISESWIYKNLKRDLEALKLPPRRVHDFRRTGISLAIEDGADELILKRGTHAPPTHIMGLYTTISWERLCDEVKTLTL